MNWTCKGKYSTIFLSSAFALLVIALWSKYMTPGYRKNDYKNIHNSLDFLRFSNINGVENSGKELLQGCEKDRDYSNNGELVVRTFGENKWTVDSVTCAELDTKKGKANFQKVFLKSLLGDMPIYIHDPRVDGVSRQVQKGNFEPHIFKTLFSLLKLDPEVGMLDIGAHIGVNALQAAKYGRNVVAIEATSESTQHICASAIDGNVLNKITLVHNAISNVHKPVKFMRAQVGQYGGAFMDDNSDLRKLKVAWDGNIFNFSDYDIINTVMLDDLLQLPNICGFRKVLIKMDVEGSEHLALDGARKFFERVDVQGVLMEYRWHVTRPTKHIILDFFDRFKYDPFDFRRGYLQKLEAKTMRNHDVLWLPQSKTPSLSGMKVY